jgi:1H-pyrrole-2-carbonyl-[peptidyl-carrier protein] brominase
VSLGIITPAARLQESGLSPLDFLLARRGDLNPELARRTTNIRMLEPAHVTTNYSHQVSGFAGPGFACLGEAHRFVDPIFSYGISAGMREAQMVAPLIRAWLAQPDPLAHPEHFEAYMTDCERAIDIIEDTTDAFWLHPMAFSACVHLKYRDEMVDILGGRLYKNQPNSAISALRGLLKRERTYERGQSCSEPLGSRYRREAPALWSADSLPRELPSSLESDLLPVG